MRSILTLAVATVLCAACAVAAWSGPLHDAAAAGDAHRVKQLLAAGADLRAPDAEGKDALRVAAEAGHAAVVLVLLDAAAADVPLATVGNHTITRQEFLARLERDHGRETLVGMLNRRLIEDAFAAAGLHISPEELQRKLAEIREQYPTQEALRQATGFQGMCEADLVESVTLELKVCKLLTKDVVVTEDELRDFLNENRASFDRPATVQYSEIVVGTAAEAAALRAEVAKPGADWAALAREHSLSPMSRKTGGTLPPQPVDCIYPPAVREALESLDPGAVGGPIEADGRWYIVRLETRTAAQEADFDRDRDRVEEGYKAVHARSLEDLLLEIKRGARVTVPDPGYRDVEGMFGPEAQLQDWVGGDAE